MVRCQKQLSRSVGYTKETGDMYSDVQYSSGSLSTRLNLVRLDRRIETSSPKWYFYIKAEIFFGPLDSAYWTCSLLMLFDYRIPWKGNIAEVAGGDIYLQWNYFNKNNYLRLFFFLWLLCSDGSATVHSDEGTPRLEIWMQKLQQFLRRHLLPVAFVLAEHAHLKLKLNIILYLRWVL